MLVIPQNWRLWYFTFFRIKAYPSRGPWTKCNQNCFKDVRNHRTKKHHQPVACYLCCDSKEGLCLWMVQLQGHERVLLCDGSHHGSDYLQKVITHLPRLTKESILLIIYRYPLNKLVAVWIHHLKKISLRKASFCINRYFTYLKLITVSRNKQLFFKIFI